MAKGSTSCNVCGKTAEQVFEGQMLISIHERIGYGSDKTITAISGLSFPFDHLNSIKEIAKQKHDERINAAKAIKSNELEDLDFSDDVVVEKEEKQKPKKLSRRDKLKMLSN